LEGAALLAAEVHPAVDLAERPVAVGQQVEAHPEEAVMEAAEAVMADRSFIIEEKRMSPSVCGHKRLFVWSTVLPVIVIVLLIVAFGSDQSFAAKSRQEVFSSPAEAVRVMVGAMKEGNAKKLRAVFGKAGKELFSSGDDAADRQMREEFVKAYDDKNRIENAGRDKAILHVGNEDWSWPIPIVKTGQTWRFDTNAGRQEILARRIGENELAAIQVCLAYVDAQQEYSQEHHTAGTMEYAQKFISDPGKTDGLCWEEKEVGKESPLGPLVGNACKVDYTARQQADIAQPYHGYYYKILKKQGAHAPGGAYDYVVDGKMIGGFALVAYPARYSLSGIMTFIVNQDGVVYQKDVGKNTEKVAEAMASFDPDQTWKRVQ
jgi:hypothetical protein